MSRDTNDLKFWAQIKPGCQIGSKGYEQFEQQAARILSTMPFSVLFSNSVYADGTVSLLRPEKDLEAGQFRGLGDDANVVVRIANEKIANLYNEDQSVNADVLRVCLERLERTKVLSVKDPNARSLCDQFSASTGRDRLLDFMAMKSREARAGMAEARGLRLSPHAA